jgi:type IV secretion system protein VirB9
MKHLLTSIAVIASLSGTAYAATTPNSLSADARVKTVPYDENNVVSLTGYYGYQTTIQFNPFEKIQNISIGDSIAWQVVPNKVGNILFVKPIEERATTNMTVITDSRIYNFELTSGLAGSPRDSRITYMLKFSYPAQSVMDFSGGEVTLFPGQTLGPYAPKTKISEDGIASAGAPKDLNFEYSYKGEPDLSPSAVFDNGEFTYFKFADMDNLPAIFAVDKKRNESVVNYHMEGGYMVIERLSPQFTLRHGEMEACVFNDNSRQDVPLFAMREAG